MQTKGFGKKSIERTGKSKGSYSWREHSSPTGAGLGLDPLSHKIIESWLQHGPQLLQQTTFPLSIDQNQETDGETKVRRTLAGDENFNFRAAYWADLHNLLYGALPVDIVLWGYLSLSFSMYDDKSKVKVEAKVLETGVTIDIVADLLIAADGCLSSIRQSFFPDLKLKLVYEVNECSSFPRF
ncbi:hypothetical protein T459_21621 [Capsicum annuum]|uniref:FAD-binding domain-containing protein n=1 Tax=Capsicum annuum TaxID=4072 RepID=A0A2G2YX74_CAPAN|nr:putative V-type proton ATPase 21 kDa proteolipid subunit-like [Capsicum annuum]PHT74344.1 hypothetical protein T459_21621 [Capsicum annuum]